MKDNKLNILFLSTENPYPPDHGHHIRTWNILKILAERYRIFFIGFKTSADNQSTISQLQNICDSVNLIENKWRGKHLPLLLLKNLFTRKPFSSQKYENDHFIRTVNNILKNHRIDLIHIDMLHLAGYKELFNSVPAFLTDHNVESIRLLRWSKVEKNLILKLFLQYQSRKLRKFEKNVCPLFTYCFVTSYEDEKVLRKLCGSKNFEVIPNGVDCDFFHPFEHVQRPEGVVWTGSMRNAYNREAVDYFLKQVYPHIKRQNNRVKITFVGEMPTRLLQIFSETEQNLKIVGYVDDVRPYIAYSELFIAPIISGSGTKIKVLNAMAMGKPVVTTSIGAEGIDGVNGKHFFVEDNPKKMADKIIYLLESKRLALQVGQAARNLVLEKYDWKVIKEKVYAIYDSIKRK